MTSIKALKTFVFAPYFLHEGETADVPDATGSRLIQLGFAGYAKGAAQGSIEVPEKKTRKSARKSQAAK